MTAPDILQEIKRRVAFVAPNAAGVQGIRVRGVCKRAVRTILLVLFNLHSLAYAQDPSLFVSDANGKYGVRNDNGETIIPEKYASISILPDGSFLVLVSKTNHIAKVLDAFDGHFICQYYKDGQLADLAVLKARDIVLFNFPSKYIHAEFVKDSCHTFVSAQTLIPGERLAVDLDGTPLTGPENVHFDHIKGSFRPCNGYVVVLKNHGHDGILFGVYDIRKKKMIVLCDFSDVVFDRESGYIKAFDKVKTLTYDLYDIHGHRVRTWEQIDSSR
jgi:hypothetical protein